MSIQEGEELVFRADRYNIHRVWFKATDGSRKSKDVIRHPGAVVLLPILADGSIVMIRNYRLSLDRVLLEAPAGTMEAGEEAEVCAARELMEETGYRAGQLRFVRTFYASPGICDEAMHVFLASDLSAGNPDRELDERIENEIVSVEQARQFVLDGTICDGKTLVALMGYFAFQASSTENR